MKEEEKEKAPKTCVYIFTNQEMPNVIKIGITSNLKQRIKDLSKPSGVPVTFECYYAIELETEEAARGVEKDMFEGLDKQRINDGREFFWTAPEDAKALLRMNTRTGAKDITPRKDIVESPEDQQALDKARKKNKAIDYFSVLGIPNGAKLTFKRDETITCEVAEGGQVIFRDEQTSMSRSALTVLNEMGYDWTKAGGPEYWCYQGETLRNLYYRREDG